MVYCVQSPGICRGGTATEGKTQMDDIILREPTAADAGRIAEYRAAFAGERMRFSASPCRIPGMDHLEEYADVRDWLRWCAFQRGRFTPCMALRPSDGLVVGFCCLRHDLRSDDDDPAFASHIGYSVHPALRGRGYGKRQLMLLLKKAAEAGLVRVRLVCAHRNEASRRTILSLGGRRVDSVYGEETGLTVDRFDILLKEIPVKVKEILGANRFPAFTGTRVGCRALVVRDGSILLSHESVSDFYLIPGGGLEEGETPEGCCIREAEEETGLIVFPREHFLTLNEYYEDMRYISHYFVCDIVGRGQMRPTEEEKRRGAAPEWLPLRAAAGIFAAHREWDGINEEKRGSYLREDTALREWMCRYGTGREE